MDPMLLIALVVTLGALWLGYLHGLEERRDTPRTISQMPPDFTQRERERLARVLDTATVVPQEAAHA
jgi:hypothetical protein